jgi:hypothetical protein
MQIQHDNYKNHMIREEDGVVEAVAVAAGWDCEWEWIFTARSVEVIKALIDESLDRFA